MPKILVSMEEAKAIIVKYLDGEGYSVIADSVLVVSHYVGQYDERDQVLDGFSVGLEMVRPV